MVSFTLPPGLESIMSEMASEIVAIGLSFTRRLLAALLLRPDADWCQALRGSGRRVRG